MDKFKTLDFGSYCEIEMFRHFADNEFYVYKVIGRVESNSYVTVPIAYGGSHTGLKEITHNEVVPCLRVVCCGVQETEVYKVRVEDVTGIRKEHRKPKLYRLECTNQDGDLENNGYYMIRENAEKAKKEIDEHPETKKYGIVQQIIEYETCD